MRTEFVDDFDFDAAHDACPWASRWLEVDGGWMMYESVSDWETAVRTAPTQHVCEYQTGKQVREATLDDVWEANRALSSGNEDGTWEELGVVYYVD